jgi:ATP-binding cassette subfamily F protein uup
MDNVVTSIIAMDGTGRVEEFIGAYTDWETKTGGLADPRQSAAEPGVSQAAPPTKASPRKITKKNTKRSYKVQRELDQLMAQIEKLEQSQAQLEREMAEPGFFERDYSIVEKATLELAELNANLGKAFERWDELEAERE